MISQFLTRDNWVVLGILSGAFFVASLIVIPIVLVRLPHDYFDESHPRIWLQNWNPVVRVTAYALKNLIGLALFLAGVAMLVLPGQGILTMLIGVSLMDFPGKRKLERRLIGRPAILRGINGIREKFGRGPLVIN